VGEDFTKVKNVIVCSLRDPAGTNIKERLLERYPFKESNSDFFDDNPVYSIGTNLFIVSSQQDIIFVDNLESQFQDSRFIFISRHRAESGIPSLTAHFTGNFGSADFGGNPGEIANYSPSLLKSYMLSLNSLRSHINPIYNLTLEATHHGPTSMKSSVLFVELGSTEIQWVDMKTAALISQALMATLDSDKKFSKCAIGIGGTHYPEKLNKLIFDSDYALGPIIPKYALQYFSTKLIEQILAKSDQEIKTALIDTKGLGKFKEEVYRILNDFGLERESI
jgi:D-aminoacyl-tRNA deacylase